MSRHGLDRLLHLGACLGKAVAGAVGIISCPSRAWPPATLFGHGALLRAFGRRISSDGMKGGAAIGLSRRRAPALDPAQPVD